MLAIRLQRLGRKGYPVYRIAVQEAQRHPSSGRIVAYVGNYNPHTKEVKFDKEKTELYLKNGAQPSPHVVKLMVQEKIAMPAWVNAQDKKDKKLRNPDKLRKNRPDEPKAPVEEKIEEKEAEPEVETPVEASETVVAEPAPEEEPVEGTATETEATDAKSKK